MASDGSKPEPPVPPRRPAPGGAARPAKPVAQPPKVPGVVPPRSVPPRLVPPQAAPPQAVPPKAVPPKAVPPKPVEPKAPQPKAVPPRAAAPAPAPAPAAAPVKKPARPAAQQPTRAPAKGAAAPAAPPSGAVAPILVADPLIGTLMARCRIEERIGQGRTSVVYRAHHETLGQDVAIKVLLPEAAAHASLVDRFQHEARVLARIDNENVLKVLDVGTQDGHHFMVVELLEGEEMLDLIERDGRVDVTDALRVVRQAAKGLAAAHDKGILHRDVKPQNLFLLEDGTVKVVDFGLATADDGGVERVGTPHYMAPEVCKRGTAEAASDVYGLGIVLWHLLVGQPPYAGKDVKSILKSHVAGVPLRPEAVRKEVMGPVAELVRAMTHLEPAQRPTASDVVSRVDELGGEEVKEKGTLVGRARRRPSRARVAAARRAQQERKASRAPTTFLWVGVAVLAIGGIVALVGSGGGSNGSGDPSTTPSGPSAEELALIQEEAAARQAAFDRQRTEAEAQQAASAKIFEAEEAFNRAVDFARTEWKTNADTGTIVARYRGVARSHKGTPAATRAGERVDGILAGTVHPHPDRQWSAHEDVELARTRWREAKDEVERLFAEGEIRKALELIPLPVVDSTGELARDLEFAREHGARLLALRRRIIAGMAAHKATADPVTLDVDGVAMTVTKISDGGFDVRGAGASRKSLSWGQVSPVEVLRIAGELARDGSAEAALERLAFAFTHNLEEPFWTAELDLGSHADGPRAEPTRKIYRSAFESR